MFCLFIAHDKFKWHLLIRESIAQCGQKLYDALISFHFPKQLTKSVKGILIEHYINIKGKNSYTSDIKTNEGLIQEAGLSPQEEWIKHKLKIIILGKKKKKS